MKSNKLLKFICIFVYAVFFLYIVLQAEYYRAAPKFDISVSDIRLYHFISSVVIPYALGLLISLPSFISAFRKQGKWKIDWIKLLAVGLPALYIAIHPLILPTTLGMYIYSPTFPRYYSDLPLVLSGVVLGYLTLSVIGKKEQE
ncbi:hypothetical protein MFMK1_003606 [Metallumcola ferriviriculae]|uniref:Uncharacterized protein n=1 Tax=Metallumcola ferriviriculae TaxID=3039180 RepID=A0AAU0UU02_9FIRM|nr:hypothetical protein MFMK1_003606 [Desulfitibacteraceae bacterium MK1]